MFFLCVHSNVFVEGHFFSKSPTLNRSPVLLNQVIEFPTFSSLKSVWYLAVGYKMAIIQDVKLVNILLRGWEVSSTEVVLHIGTQVQGKALISWMLFCVIVLLQNSCLKWFLIAWSSIYTIIHACTHSQWRDVKLLNTLSGSLETLLFWRFLCSEWGMQCETTDQLIIVSVQNWIFWLRIVSCLLLFNIPCSV